jgi:hypothetical protein
MSPITIPPAAEKAAELAIITLELDHENRGIMPPTPAEKARAACLAMLKNWPKMHIGAPWVIGVPNAPSIILPLNTEPSDDT